MTDAYQPGRKDNNYLSHPPRVRTHPWKRNAPARIAKNIVKTRKVTK